MKKYLTISIIIAFLLILTTVVIQDRKISQLTSERDKYKHNTESLLEQTETYKVRDSLNAAKVGTLELTIKELKKYRAEDAKLAEELAGRNRDLERLSKAQAQTIIELRSAPRDTTIIIDSVRVKAKKVKCGDEWYTFEGLVTEDEFTGTMKTWDELVLTETVRYKKILWWKTKKVKDRELEIASKNTHTEITGLEHIIIDH